MMELSIPKTSDTLSSLLRADLTTQWRNRRSFILVLLMPVIILVSWRSAANKNDASFVLSTCITLGLVSIGLMGYSNAIARDRDKGIFQRLRVAPVPTGCIMTSRLLVQLLMIVLLTIIVFIAGYQIDKITLSFNSYLLSFFASIAGGAVYLGLGQIIVGRIKNAETVNSMTRLTYIVFIVLGIFGEQGAFGEQTKQIVHYSPYGTVKDILKGSMEFSSWNSQTSLSLLITFCYIIVFSFLGIKWFKWK
jgi:ABC-2 type transport system permease protein